MNTLNKGLRSILIEVLMKARLIHSESELESLIESSIPKIVEISQYSGQLFSEKEVSHLYKFLDVTKLRNLRSKGGGPRYYKFGTGKNGRVFYKYSDIQSWIQEHEQTKSSILSYYR